MFFLKVHILFFYSLHGHPTLVVHSVQSLKDLLLCYRSKFEVKMIKMEQLNVFKFHADTVTHLQQLDWSLSPHSVHLQFLQQQKFKLNSS